MRPERIRHLVRKRPFRQIELLAEGGEKLIIRHPEAVVVGKELICVELPDGMVDYIEARRVTKVRVLRRRAAPR